MITKRTQIKIVLILALLFCMQIFSYAQDRFSKKGKYLYKEKMTALKMAAVLAEREGKKDEIKEQYRLMAKTCEETASTPFVAKKVKRKAKRLHAEALMKLGDFEEAISICDEMLESNPGDKSALIKKAFIYKEMGEKLLAERKYDEAFSYFKSINGWDITPELNAFFKSITGWAYLQKGDYEKSENCFKSIIEEHCELKDWQAGARVMLSSVCVMNNKTDQAKKHLNYVIQNYPRSGWYEAAVNNLNSL